MSGPVPIIYCIGTLGIGGAERHLVQVVGRLNRSLWIPHVFAISEGGPLEEELRALGVQVQIFNYEGIRVRRFLPGTLRPLWELQRAIVAVKPAIVHSYLYWANVVGSLAASAAGVPVVISARRGLGEDKEKQWYYQPLENLVNRFADAITVNSQGVLHDVYKRERHVDGKLYLIYNGVEWDQFARPVRNPAVLKRNLGIPPNAVVVGCVANLILYKGHHDLLEAAAKVLRVIPTLYLVMVGRDGGALESLRDHARALGIADRIRWLGTRTDIADLLHTFDVQVLPSHQEGFSNVILEGMSAARPLVVTDVGGNAEAVVDGQTGLIVPPRQPERLAGAILELLQDSERAISMGRNGQERVRSTFSMAAMMNGLEELYAGLINQQ